MERQKGKYSVRERRASEENRQGLLKYFDEELKIIAWIQFVYMSINHNFLAFG